MSSITRDMVLLMIRAEVGRLGDLEEKVHEQRLEEIAAMQDLEDRVEAVESGGSEGRSVTRHNSARLDEIDDTIRGLQDFQNEQRSDTEKLERRVTRFEEMDQETTSESVKLDVDRGEEADQ